MVRQDKFDANFAAFIKGINAKACFGQSREQARYLDCLFDFYGVGFWRLDQNQGQQPEYHRAHFLPSLIGGRCRLTTSQFFSPLKNAKVCTLQ